MAKRKQKKDSLVAFIIAVIIALLIYYQDDIKRFLVENIPMFQTSYALEEIPAYQGKPFVYINNNEPNFTTEDYNTKELEVYSDLDILKRAGVAFAKVGIETMPTEERGSIGMVKPTGWHTVKYDFVDGKYLYNRCHLIGFQLTGENANEKNLITCTRSANTGAMLDYENKVANYVKKTNNHVLYRVTPIYEGSNLVASGIEMEALSIEDNGKGIKFHIYVYNVEDGVEIDYKTGDSKEIVTIHS